VCPTAPPDKVGYLGCGAALYSTTISDPMKNGFFGVHARL